MELINEAESMTIKSLKLLSDGYFELDMGMLVYAKTPYYGIKYMAALKPLLIETNSENILIDTGIGDLPDKYNQYYKADRSQTLKESLAKIGLSLDDISMIINTHLHVDHCGNNRLFENAKIIVQDSELKYAFNPHRFQKGGYIKEMFEDIKFKTISGNQELLPGISVILTSGHSPGHQAVVVDATDSKIGKKYIYCGDEAPLEENLMKRNITGVLFNQVKSLEAIDIIRSINAEYIYSHDRTQLEI
jgi:glyoxylase-like metal-dependent hydrolase (beta-lactamase superfamily II)